MVAGRRTYADIFLPLAGDDFEDTYLYFFDLNAKITHKINDNNRLYLSAYYGRDRFGMNDIAGMGFGNQSLSSKWKHIFSKNLYSNLEINGTAYSYNMEMEMKPYGIELNAGMKDWNLRYDMTKIWNSKHTSRIGISGIYHRFTLGDLSNNNDENSVQIIEDTTLGCRKALEYGYTLPTNRS